MTDLSDTATVDSSLRLGGGFRADERGRILDHLGNLDHRLRSFRSDAVDLELAVKERDTPSQRTTLAADISGWPRLVATSTETSLTKALNEVRDDLIRQITDAKNRTEPRQNRHRRDTTP
jgi:ribosome-associated translation inhibitor RaiA